MISGVEKKNWNFGAQFACEVQEKNILGLKAARQTCLVLIGDYGQLTSQKFTNSR